MYLRTPQCERAFFFAGFTESDSTTWWTNLKNAHIVTVYGIGSVSPQHWITAVSAVWVVTQLIASW